MKIIKSNNLENVFIKNKNEDKKLYKKVRKILDDIRLNKDKALKKYTKKFDNIEINNFKIENDILKNCYENIDSKKRDALKYSIKNIKNFSKKQLSLFKEFKVEIEKDTFLKQKIKPITSIGAYIPGGNFPLVSSALMSIVPAKVAGVKNISACIPPDNNYPNLINPAVAAALYILDIDNVYIMGGAQAIAALAYGTDNIKKVDKIVGPGNKFVTAAKKIVYGNTGIDFPAGPSEILLIADKSAKCDYIIQDILSQSEHDKDAKSFLLTTSNDIIKKVSKNIEQIIKKTDSSVLKKSLKNNCYIIKAESIEECCKISDKIAPEHLEIQTENNKYLENKLNNYGTLFIGENSCEPLGDYASGLNHILPTNSAARFTGGLNVKDFIKMQTVLEVKDINKKNKKMYEASKIIAEIEGMKEHFRALEIRR